MSIMRDVAAGLNEVGIPPAPGNSKWSAAYLQRARAGLDQIESFGIPKSGWF